ncbi:transposase [Ectothiorhodospiraceae bacterium WFHF3C12]|nr:transposase [Ectothiorhodospiraceae bacterium WFHF3C12]
MLDAWMFIDFTHVREESERWLAVYNTMRPHDSLGDISPIEFLNGRGHAGVSAYEWVQTGKWTGALSE